MIKELTMYTVVCDECRQQLNEGDEIIAWSDKVNAQDIAMKADWVTVDNKHYCNDCYYYDEDDKLIIQMAISKRKE